MYLGKWFKMRFLFSGNILSCSMVNLSISWRLRTRNTEPSRERPKM